MATLELNIESIQNPYSKYSKKQCPLPPPPEKISPPCSGQHSESHGGFPPSVISCLSMSRNFNSFMCIK